MTLEIYSDEISYLNFYLYKYNGNVKANYTKQVKLVSLYDKLINFEMLFIVSIILLK